MKNDLWKQVKGVDHIVSFSDSAWRIVESQNSLVTRKLVDSLGEQDILEELIESSKPALTEDLLDLHPLLYTPFRYPPLKYGSRFGNRFEPSLWYGSLDLNTAMTEIAYYRFSFLNASKADFGNVISDHTAFSAQIKTNSGIDLRQLPFSNFTQSISSVVSYQESQRLGSAMRQENIEAFYYQSARDPNKGSNLALFTPKAFLHKKPHGSSFQSWQCIVNKKIAEFVRLSAMTAESKSFIRDLFLSEGKLPITVD